MARFLLSVWHDEDYAPDFESPEARRQFAQVGTFNAELQAAFEVLTPGRRREYNLYFSGAKQSTTRAARIEKHVPRILDGKSLRDR